MVGTHHPRRLTVELQRINDYVWEIPRQGGMRVPGRIYASEKLMAELRDDPALEQVANVAHLPGIVGHALAMPDIHWGYGFPIGGVAAVDAEEGAISPGGIGFDINCGVRLLRTALAADGLGPHLGRLADALYQAIPAVVGSEVAIPMLTLAEEKQMLARGAAWAVAREFGRASGREATEEGGWLRDADQDAVSDTALERGRSQVGTLGSGNHFLEVQRVDEVYDARAAAALGLAAGQVTVMIHSGSRGLGYQVCDDALRTMGRAMARYGFSMPDRQLACVPLGAPEGREYFAAMAAAANFAWTNRQVMSGLTERAFATALGLGPAALRFGLVYDVCHNIAKLEEHAVDGRRRRVCVHRKGATRAFGPGGRELPDLRAALPAELHRRPGHHQGRLRARERRARAPRPAARRRHRPRRRRGGGGQARRRVRARRLPDRLRDLDQHERQRGDREPRPRAARRKTRRQERGASERPREHGPEHQRRLPDRHPRGCLRRDHARAPPGARGAGGGLRGARSRLRRRREGRPHAPPGRGPHDARAGVRRLRERHPPRHRARAGAASSPGRAADRRHRPRQRAERAAGLRGEGRGGAGARDRALLRDRAGP